MCVCVPVHTFVMQRPGGGQRTTWESQLSPSAMRVPGAEFKLSSSLDNNPCTSGDSSPASCLSFSKHLSELGFTYPLFQSRSDNNLGKSMS